MVGTNCVEILDSCHLLKEDFWVGKSPFCLIQRKKNVDVRGKFRSLCDDALQHRDAVSVSAHLKTT